MAMMLLVAADANARTLPSREADAFGQTAYNRLCDLEDAMATPTRSVADLAVKATSVASRHGARGWDDDHCVRRLVADVIALAAARH